MRVIFKPPESLKKNYVFDELNEKTDADGLFVAALWQSWYNAGNPQGDELNLVFVDNEPLSYWLRKLEERMVRHG